MRVAGPFAAVGAVLSGALAVLVLAGVAAGEASLQERLAAASPEHGQKVFRMCRACHTIDAGAAHTVGPNLWGVVGRPVAVATGYDRYTPAMSSFGGIWSAERLDRYLRQPMVEVEETAMVFPGIPSAADRADLIAWLNRNSPAPSGFGSEPAAAGNVAGAEGTEGARAAAPRPVQPPVPGVLVAGEGASVSATDRKPSSPPDLGVLVAGEGAEETHAYCTACHSEWIVAQQGLTRSDWEELLEQMVEGNGMTPIKEPDLDRILSYLATHYGVDRPNFSKP